MMALFYQEKLSQRRALEGVTAASITIRMGRLNSND
jgi:hypothetical protein